MVVFSQSPGELKLICLARCGSLCVATDNVLHVLDTGFHGDKNGTVEQNGTTMAFKFGKFKGQICFV